MGPSSSAVRAATAAEEKGSGNGKADMLELSSGDHFGERELFFRHQEETNAVRERTPASITTTTLALVAVGPSSRISLPTGPLASFFPVCFGFVVSLTRSLIYICIRARTEPAGGALSLLQLTTHDRRCHASARCAQPRAWGHGWQVRLPKKGFCYCGYTSVQY